MDQTVFIAHPFATPIGGYRSAIKSACALYEVSPVFPDWSIGDHRLMEPLVSSIKKADAVIVDITLLNLNVLIEYGISRALKPNTLTVISRFVIEPSEMPADLRGIVYQTYVTKSGLRSTISKVLETQLGASQFIEDEKALRMIAKLFRKNISLARSDVSARLNIAEACCSRLLRELVADGTLQSQGSGRGTRYSR